MNLNKILFFDIESVGVTRTYEELQQLNPRLYQMWHKVRDERYKDVVGSYDEVWESKAGLHPEFGKIVCISFGRLLPNGQKDVQSFHGDDEKDILQKAAIVLRNSDVAGYEISGYNIEKFDIPYMWKRMLVNGVQPPSIINIWNKKPWELKMFDLAKFWNGGIWSAMTPLDTVGALMGIDSSKDSLNGRMVHDEYWGLGTERICNYCEADVVATMDVAKKMVDLVQI